MQIGSFSVEVLSEGRFEVFNDGHINRVSSSEEVQGSNDPHSSSAIVGINPILVQTGSHNILLDAGLGWGLDSGSDYANVSNVQTNLRIFGLDPTDITHVILSHLHYDHAAGCSFTSEDFTTKATFPNATYYLHEREWKHAITQTNQKQENSGAGYNLDDFYRLIADDKVELLQRDYNDIVDGITTIHTGGHTHGHQVTIIKNNGMFGYYLGDLLPSSSHLNHYAMSQLDTNPIMAKKKKIQLLRSAFEENACLFFYHSQHSQVGSLEKNDNRQYVLKEL